jgi:hypothetical protein
MATTLLKSLRSDRTDAPDLSKECHLGKRKAESSIRIGAFDDTRDIGYARSGAGCCTCRESPDTLVNAACTEPMVKNAKQAKKLVKKMGSNFFRYPGFTPAYGAANGSLLRATPVGKHLAKLRRG